MSQQSVAMIQRGIELWNRGDVDAWLELLDADVEMTPVIAQLVEGGESVYRGIPGARRFWEDWRVAWDFRFGETELREVGEQVLMVTEVFVTGRDGLELKVPMAAVFTLKGGRLRQMTSHLEEAEALKAVGLSE